MKHLLNFPSLKMAFHNCYHINDVSRSQSIFSIFTGLSYEYTDKGITIQCLCPGPVETDMIRGLMKGEEKQMSMSWMIPEVSKYTASAMRTLGFSFHTMGYWTHSLISTILPQPHLSVLKMANEKRVLKQISEKEKNS